MTDMKRFLLAILITVCFSMFLLSATDDTSRIFDASVMHLRSEVPRASGVEIPEGATLVGNLLVEYSYGDSEWTYVTEALVDIPELGTKADRVYLQASYYGNEPSDYDCTVDFSTGGWNRAEGQRSLQRIANGEVLFDNESSDLPIAFENLSVAVMDLDRSSTKTEIDVWAGEDDSSFSVHVPVQEPINGRLVAQIQAAWPQKDLPSGKYEADIQISVSANL